MLLAELDYDWLLDDMLTASLLFPAVCGGDVSGAYKQRKSESSVFSLLSVAPAALFASFA